MIASMSCLKTFYFQIYTHDLCCTYKYKTIARTKNFFARTVEYKRLECTAHEFGSCSKYFVLFLRLHLQAKCAEKGGIIKGHDSKFLMRQL